jgi:DNA-binding response OmpR family regulator
MHILVVEDDAQVRDGLTEGLRAHGYGVVEASNVLQAKRAMTATKFGLVVLDLMLGDEEAWPLLAFAVERSLPAIILTSRADVPTRLQALEGGAVDYVAKPFFIVELIARIRLRTQSAVSKRDRIAFGDAALDLIRRELRLRDAPVSLTPGEYDVLAYLLVRPGRAISRATLAADALSDDRDRCDHTVDSHVSRLRGKLGESARHIKTVWGIGWRFDP